MDRLLEWLNSNLLTILISGVLPIILLYLQNRKNKEELNKIKSEGRKTDAESRKIDAETDSIEIKNDNDLVGIWQNTYKELKEKYDEGMKLNKENALAINSLQDVITELKHKQKAILEFVNNVLYVITEPRPDVFSIVDEKKICLYISPNVFEVLGYSPLDFFNKDRTDIIHPEDKSNFDRIFFHTLQFPEIASKITLRVRKSDGAYIWMEATIMNLLRTHVRGIFFSSRDVTKIKLAQEEYQKIYAEK